LSYEVFDSYASRYDDWYFRNRIIAENEVKLLKSFGTTTNSIEIGVGTGFFASSLDIEYGIDPSINMLKIAKSRGVEVIRAFGEYLPFRNECFSRVYLIITLCFVDNPRDVLREIYRVLKSDGDVIICIVPRNSSWGQYYIEKAKRGHPIYSQAHFYTIDEILQIASEIGMGLIEIRATLSFEPKDELRYEEPHKYRGYEGFVCLRLIK